MACAIFAPERGTVFLQFLFLRAENEKSGNDAIIFTEHKKINIITLSFFDVIV